MSLRRRPFASLAAFSLTLLLAACASGGPAPEAITPAPKPAPVKPIRIGLALGGGAAKGFAHIGVIKMLEANGLRIEVVSGTSAGSVVGALYASGMDAFQMQKTAFGLDEAQIRDVSLFSGGVVKGQKLQDYVNQLVGNRPLERMKKPFAVVSTQLETGERTVFVRGNTGQAVRASSSIPGDRCITSMAASSVRCRWMRRASSAPITSSPSTSRPRPAARIREACSARSTSRSRSWARSWASRSSRAPTW
jgi:NTE family protein